MAIVTSVLTAGTKQIPLSGGGMATIDAEDYALVSRWKWKNMNGRAGRNVTLGFIGHWRNNKRVNECILMHRLITDAPKGMEVDHINGDPLDNRRANLRICTHAENRANTKRPTNNKSGFKGVYYSSQRKKWVVNVGYMGKTHNFAAFDDLVEAAKEYDFIAKQLFGEYARLNFGDLA